MMNHAVITMHNLSKEDLNRIDYKARYAVYVECKKNIGRWRLFKVGETTQTAVQRCYQIRQDTGADYRIARAFGLTEPSVDNLLFLESYIRKYLIAHGARLVRGKADYMYFSGSYVQFYALVDEAIAMAEKALETMLQF